MHFEKGDLVEIVAPCAFRGETGRVVLVLRAYIAVGFATGECESFVPDELVRVQEKLPFTL